jgi:hypothetical protein
MRFRYLFVLICIYLFLYSCDSLRQGVSLDTQFNEGNTLMHFAVSLDMYTEVAFLLDAGANYLIANAGVNI